MSNIVVDDLKGPQEGNHAIAIPRGNTLYKPGQVIQTVWRKMDFQASYASNYSTTSTPISGLDLTITLKRPNSFIYVQWWLFYESHHDIMFQGLRNGTQISGVFASFNTQAGQQPWSGLASAEYEHSFDQSSTPSYEHMCWMDQPGSVGPHTYSLGSTCSNGNNYSIQINRTWSSTGSDSYEVGVSWAMIEEIAYDGLVFEFDAANPGSANGSTTTWYDLSSNKNNATQVGAPVSAGSTNFTGANYVTIPFNSRSVTLNNEQTINLWLRPQENDAVRRNPYAQAYAGGGTITHEPDGSFSYYWGTGGGDNSPYAGFGSGFTVAQNEWAMITLVRSTSNVQWFKNGVLINSYGSNPYNPAVTGTNPIYIGYGYAGYYIGQIPVAQLWSRALSATEVAEQFSLRRSRYGI